MANYTQIPYLSASADLTDVAYVNTERLGYMGATWVRTVGSVPSSNTNLYRPGPTGNYWVREFTPVDFSITSGRNARETVLFSYDFSSPGVYAPFYSTTASGGTTTIYNGTIDSNPFGLAALSTGTTTSGSAWVGTGTNFYSPNNTSRIATETVFSVPVFSTAGTEEFATIIGLSSSTTGVTNTIGFRVDTSATTARVINNSSTSGSPLSGLSITTNTRYRTRVEHYYSAGAYSAKFYMRAEPTYVSPREWPWVPADVIGTITDGTGGTTFLTGVTYGAGIIQRKLAGTSSRTVQISQMIVSTGF